MLARNVFLGREGERAREGTGGLDRGRVGGGEIDKLLSCYDSEAYNLTQINMGSWNKYGSKNLYSQQTKSGYLQGSSNMCGQAYCLVSSAVVSLKHCIPQGNQMFYKHCNGYVLQTLCPEQQKQPRQLFHLRCYYWVIQCSHSLSVFV